MKILSALALVICLSAHAQVSLFPLRITGLRNGTLLWSNQVSAPSPVYEVLAANTVTGAWQRVFSVTNQSSTLLSNRLGTAAGAVFHKLNWSYSNDAHMVFDYYFDEGYGVPAVTGTFDISSFVFFGGTNVGSWVCEDYLCIDCLHPTGARNFGSGAVDWSSSPHTVVLNFTPGSERVFLVGEMETSLTNGRQVYTGMYGDVWLSGSAGYSYLGSFEATRR